MPRKRLLVGIVTLILVVAVVGIWSRRRSQQSPVVQLQPATIATMDQKEQAGSSPRNGDSDPSTRIRSAIVRLKQAGALPPMEPEDIAAHAGNDPQKMSTYIKTYFTYEPYVGILRGGRGALLSDSGNDLDLMLVLQDAIRGANKTIPIQYVHAPFPRNYTLQRRPGTALPSLSAQQIATITGLDVHEVESDLADAENPEITTLNNLISEEAGAIGRELSRAVPAKQPSSALLPADHWWLRVQVGGDSVDFDPLFEPGDASHKAGVAVSDLPSSLYHRIGLQLVLQRIQDNKLVEEVLYRQEWKTADLAGTVPSLEILPEDFGPTNFEANLSSANRFQAVVHAGDDKTEYGRVFDLDGSVYTASGNNFVKTPMGSGVQGLGQSVFGQLAHGPGRSAPAESPTASQLASLRLEIQISSPGQSARSYRRWIVNRLDREAQARGQLVVRPEWQPLRKVRAPLFRSYQLLPLLGPVGPSMVASDVSRIILGSELVDEAAAIFDKKSHPDANRMQRPSALAETLLSSVAALGQGLGSAQERAALMFSRPGVLLYRESLLDEPPTPALQDAIDVVATGATGMIPGSAVRYGVALSYAELDTGAGGAAIQPLAAARRAGVPFRLLQSEADIGTLDWPSSAKDRIAEQLAGGDLVLVPQKRPASAAIAWWRVDLMDGVPIATSSDGEGQAIIEGTGLLREVSIPQVQRTLAYVACINVAIVGRGAAPEQANAECLCEFIGGTLNASAEKFARAKAVDKITEVYGLGPQVKLILSESIKQMNKAAKLPPKQPISLACRAITH